mmetsp:Transcript_22191/g.33807  ORF Transcript_22191/g.33807 Transcript_22191/m.33807 type:complete len:357 (-) Transcript_22191:126-1196(-)|eukprot:CAMPEP_0194123882 /NCGR_PEP_ID=MMETSP0150-20130528/56364_1 /TAXON_ID=122233 /ORGANISM="Chaetoceros debilis, Strain MM31A-1" /LENGTH=356 /DNA_ID=CAMNT_0038817339 /DNA_START=112 /DNA_END=1182 /DNA_ORIENTATION=+
MTDRRFLEAQLASLLSFEIEDAEDVIEHLLAFDSESDLLEHMCALLGEENDEVKLFVSNIMKFQKGIPIDIDIPDVKDTLDNAALNSESESTNKATQFNANPTISKKQQESKQTEKEKKERRKQEENDRLRQLKEEKEQLDKLERMRIEQMKALEELRAAQAKEDAKIQEELQKAMEESSLSSSKSKSKKNQKAAAAAASVPHKKKNSKQKKEPTKPKPPPMGKAKVICGCFGTINKPLTNCLHCGRILCEKEGYGYCPHCGHLIEKTPTGAAAGSKSKSGSSEAFEKAMLHKERLLQFDKDSASRTVVYDDQADYFQNESSMWLTNEEQKENSVKEEKRRQDMHTIKKQILKINF